MVEEALRWDPPIQCTFRRATQDDNIEGVDVKTGDMVIPMWAGANWDPEVFPNPELFDIDRPTTKPHMGFGFGPHFCAGAELARLETKIAFEELLGRLGDIKLDESESDLSHLPSFASHGYQKIGLSFTGSTNVGVVRWRWVFAGPSKETRKSSARGDNLGAVCHLLCIVGNVSDTGQQLIEEDGVDRRQLCLALL